MKYICISRSEGFYGLDTSITVGKIYEGSIAFKYKNEYQRRSTELIERDSSNISIVNDFNINAEYSIKQFKTIEDDRNDKLNALGIK